MINGLILKSVFGGFLNVNKDYWNKIFSNWFNLPKDKRILFYRNPKDCKDFTYEKVNPDHIGIVWGLQKHKKTWVRVCKVTLTQIAWIFTEYINQLFLTFDYLFKNLDMLLCFYYIVMAVCFYCIILNIPIVETILCLKR